MTQFVRSTSGIICISFSQKDEQKCREEEEEKWNDFSRLHPKMLRKLALKNFTQTSMTGEFHSDEQVNYGKLTWLAKKRRKVHLMMQQQQKKIRKISRIFPFFCEFETFPLKKKITKKSLKITKKISKKSRKNI